MKKKKLIIIGAVVLLIVIAVMWFMSSREEVEYVTAQASKGMLLQTVTETGTIKPAKELSLNFSGSGRIDQILVSVGTKVVSGDVLAVLDRSDLDIRLKEAEASVLMARAQLDKLLAGASAEDRAVTEANYNEAQSAYNNAVKEQEEVRASAAQAVAQAQTDYDNLINNQPGQLSTARQSVSQAQTALENTKKTYQNSIDNRVDALATTIQSKLAVATAGIDAVNRIISDDSIESLLSRKNSSYISLTKSSYELAKQSIATADKAQLQGDLSVAEVTADYKLAIQAVNDSFKSLNYCFSALDNSITSGAMSQSSLDAFKTNINSHISSVSLAISTLQSAKQAMDESVLAYDTSVSASERNLDQARAVLDESITRTANAVANAKTAQSQQLISAASRVEMASKSLSAAEAQMNKVNAGARIEDVSLQRAQVKQAEASLDLIRNQLSNNRIIAPGDGVITKVDFHVGEQAVPGQAVIAMIAENNYEIEIDVSETDIPKIQVANAVSITLDAYGEDVVLEGSVGFIEPAETVIQGVTYYKVKINFTPTEDVVLKPGLTATAKIVTNKKDNVISIPQRAVTEKDNKKFVKVMEYGQPVEKVVILGMTGDGGLVEVIDGLNGGEAVITSTKTNLPD